MGFVSGCFLVSSACSQKKRAHRMYRKMCSSRIRTKGYILSCRHIMRPSSSSCVEKSKNLGVFELPNRQRKMKAKHQPGLEQMLIFMFDSDTGGDASALGCRRRLRSSKNLRKARHSRKPPRHERHLSSHPTLENVCKTTRQTNERRSATETATSSCTPIPSCTPSLRNPHWQNSEQRGKKTRPTNRRGDKYPWEGEGWCMATPAAVTP